MTQPTPQEMGLSLAWRFTDVLPGTFERDREEVAGIAFPIVGPLPTNANDTQPLEGASLVGPYLYVVTDGKGVFKYIGVATEAGLRSPLKRWIRPDKFGINHFWAHGTNKKRGKATVAWLAEGLTASEGPFELHFSNYRHFLAKMMAYATGKGIDGTELAKMSPKAFLEGLEFALIHRFQPQWNTQKKKGTPPTTISACAEYWLA